jgi:signal recognition particle receptor subunit beta
MHLALRKIAQQCRPEGTQMAVFNHSRKEIDAKIVYYGPGISGKTTNLQFIHQNLKPDQRGKMVSLATNEERTLFFDFLPIELESVRGFKTRFHLYTVPGQVYYGATRRAVLSGADGVIFVADSQTERMEDNISSLKDLEENLRYYGKKIENVPLIIQYNKRDLPNIFPVEEINQRINLLNVPYFGSVATQGKGVFETLTMACRLVLKAIEGGVEARKTVKKPQVTQEKPSVLTPEVGKKGGLLESPMESQGLGQEKSLRPEKSISSGEAVPLMVEDKLATPIKAEKDIFPPEPSIGIPDRTPKVGPIPDKEIFSPDISEKEIVQEMASPTDEEEKKKTNGRTIFSRIFERIRPEPVLTSQEKPLQAIPVNPGKMQITSCGQPHVFTTGGLRIPITIAIEGVEKEMKINLVINLEQLEPQSD